MKNKIFISFLVLFACISAFSQQMTINFNYGAFATHTGETYIETYLSIPQNTLKNVSIGDNIYNSSTKVMMIFKKNDTIAEFLKYELLGIPTADTGKINNHIIDQQRIFLDNGIYDIEISVVDKFDTTNKISGTVRAEINIPKGVMSSSTICFIDSYTKTITKNILTRGNYDLVPYISNFFPQSKNVLTYYHEVYNVDKVVGKEVSHVNVVSQMEDYENSGHVITKTIKSKRVKVMPVIRLLENIDITSLGTGNYWLEIILKDDTGKELMSTRKFFQRHGLIDEYDINELSDVVVNNSFTNKYSNIDTLRDIILSMYPKATYSERSFINHVKKNTDVDVMQKFLLRFWSDRDVFEPEKAFNAYIEEVKKVNTMYGNSIRKGYDTDRGRVYLQYGAPNHVERNVFSPGTKPYEIWQYYELAGQRDKRFVFASNDPATKDYELIHSNMLGEINDPKWQYRLYNAPTQDNSEEYQEMWGAPLQRAFDNPF